MSLLEHETALAIETARAAAVIVLDVYDRSFDVAHKSRGEPVTEADRLANSYIVERIASVFPRDGIVAEESVPTKELLAEQVSRDRVWFIDPLDGTKEFIARNGEFSVMIGLAVGGRPVLGVVSQPTINQIAVGVVGHGAWLIDSDGSSASLCVSDRSNVRECTILVSRSHRSGDLDRIVDTLGPAAWTPCGSVGVKITRIAQKMADMYINLPNRRGSKLWDGCAPEAILVAAGGLVTDISGDLIQYATTDLDLAGGYFATNGRIHRDVLAAAGICATLSARAAFQSDSSSNQ